MIVFGLCVLVAALVFYGAVRLWAQTRREEWDRRDNQVTLALHRAKQEREREDLFARQGWTTMPFRHSDWTG